MRKRWRTPGARSRAQVEETKHNVRHRLGLHRSVVRRILESDGNSKTVKQKKELLALTRGVFGSCEIQ